MPAKSWHSLSANSLNLLLVIITQAIGSRSLLSDRKKLPGSVLVLTEGGQPRIEGGCVSTTVMFRSQRYCAKKLMNAASYRRFKHACIYILAPSELTYLLIYLQYNNIESTAHRLLYFNTNGTAQQKNYPRLISEH